MSGRFAPSPSGELHLGNLRTAAVAWLSARATGTPFFVRVEDLDQQRSSPEHERTQLADLAAIGLDWDGKPRRQSERLRRYQQAIDRLSGSGLVYECFCTRREIREEIDASPNAPHLPPGSYPGTCREMDAVRRADLRAAGRLPALRLRTDGQRIDFDDIVAGPWRGGVDDLVLRRNDGTPAYNLAVVVDDAEQGISQVVRGDDLLDSTPRLILLQRLLDYPTPQYIHVPLVVDDTGERLAKRDGAVTLSGLRAAGVPVSDVVAWIARSLDLAHAGESPTLDQLVSRFDPAWIPRRPVPVPNLG
jgi:glutamyl-tRNA synthetase